MEEASSWVMERTIMRDRFRRTFVIPLYTPKGWWECDVMEITSAGYMVEYEIKTTIKDFKADTKKREAASFATRRFKDLDIGDAAATKHSLIEKGSLRGPSRFYFVTPPELIALPESARDDLDPLAILPSWAGLIEIRHGRWWKATRVVDAPRIHRQKASPEIEKHARRICYYRMHEEFQRRGVLDVPEGSDPGLICSRPPSDWCSSLEFLGRRLFLIGDSYLGGTIPNKLLGVEEVVVA